MYDNKINKSNTRIKTFIHLRVKTRLTPGNSMFNIRIYDGYNVGYSKYKY